MHFFKHYMTIGLLALSALAKNEDKNWIVMFRKEATEQNMKEVEQWIAQKGEVIEVLNDEYLKLLVVKMDDIILELTKGMELGKCIETIEVDSDDFDDSHEEL